jgi:hypothetical protein
MEPDYKNMDPVEGTNKFLAAFSLILGVLSLCAGLVPVCGGGISIVGIVVGVFGRRSDSRKLAAVGIAVSVLGLILSMVYAYFVYIQKS